jgi:hypothetical protein
MSPIGCPETSVRNYHYSLRNDPEERSLAVGLCSINSKGEDLKFLGCYIPVGRSIYVYWRLEELEWQLLQFAWIFRTRELR